MGFVYNDCRKHVNHIIIIGKTLASDGKTFVEWSRSKKPMQSSFTVNLQLVTKNRNPQTLCVRNPCFGCLGQYQFKDCQEIKIKVLANGILAPIGVDKKMMSLWIIQIQNLEHWLAYVGTSEW